MGTNHKSPLPNVENITDLIVNLFGRPFWNSIPDKIIYDIDEIPDNLLMRIRDKIKSYFNTKGQFPSAFEFEYIYELCKQGLWNHININSWSDLLRTVVPTDTTGFWTSDIGFKCISQILKDYKIKEQKNPEANNFTWICNYLYIRGGFERYGIESWDDLIYYLFHVRKNSWFGIEGLNHGKQLLKNYYEKKKKIPTSNEFETIAKVCGVGYWKAWGINSWHCLLVEVFGLEKIKKKYSWKGIEGLNQAKQQLKEYYQKNDSLPPSHETISIQGSCRRGYWKAWGINTWCDLLVEVLGQDKIEKKYSWKGIEGLNQAKHQLKEYYEKKKVIPVSSDFSSITNSCFKGYWKAWGINTWRDLLVEVLGQDKIEKKYSWKGIEGLNQAKQQIKEYYDKNQKPPSSRSFRSISNVCEKGYWEAWGIHSWHDLLVDIFGQKIYTFCKWDGIDGLNQAKQQLKEYYEEYHTIPTSSNLHTIFYCCNKGYWKAWGINSWHNLLVEVFGKDKIRNN